MCLTNGLGRHKALMDYVLLPRRMLGRQLDVKVWRGEGGGLSAATAEIIGWLEERREDLESEKCVEGE